MKRFVLAFIAVALIFPVAARAQQNSYSLLTTGNGFGFQVFDYSQNKITNFLEHPYRYLRPDSSNPHGEGIVRRNLVYDFYFGVSDGTHKGWLNDATAVTTTTPEYIDQAHIIHAPAKVGGAVAADSYFFAPFDYPGNAMVALLNAPAATDAYVLFNFHMGTATNPDMPGNDGESVRASANGHAVVETGPGGGFMVYVPLSPVDHEDCSGVYGKLGTTLADNTSCSGTDVVPGFQRHFVAADNGWMGVAMQFVDSTNSADADAAAAALVTWVNSRTPDKILADARSEFEGWRKPPASNVSLCSSDETKLWRQSEAVLRMAQVREPNISGRVNNGMILASLMGAGNPFGNWHTGWVRDGTYAIVALSRMGHYAEAKAALNFFMNAGPVGSYASYVNNVSYRISLTRYFGNGQEECDWDSTGPNIETDGWGLVLWAARNYVDASGDSAWLTSMTSNGAVYDILHNQVAAAIESNLEASNVMRADSSIWETHQPGAHYLYTSMAASRGLCDFAAIAKDNGTASDQSHYATVASKIKTALLSAFLDNQMALGGSLEGLSGNHYDASAAEVFNWSLLTDYTSNIATATFNLLNQLRVQSGGFKRNNNGPDVYDSNEWILVDLRTSDALRRSGDTKDADGFLGQVVSKAAPNFYLLPELYNDSSSDGQIGIYTGSIPMVGYGAGAYIMTILDRSGVGEPNDCGDGNSVSLAKWSCSGATGGSGGSGGGGSGGSGGGGGSGGSGGSGGGGGSGGSGVTMGDGGTDNIPYRAACLCDVGGAGATGGTLLFLLLPWLALAVRLARRQKS